jgi:hypothetical protein
MTEPTFSGEVQFRRWSDSSTQGVQVTFALPDSDSLEPLKGLEGKRFMAVLVQIGDDEKPVEPVKRGPLCIEACEYCKDKDFQRWAAQVSSTDPSEANAKAYILSVCRVSSRKELDYGPPSAGAFFRQEIRVPFMRWQREQRGVRLSEYEGMKE